MHIPRKRGEFFSYTGFNLGSPSTIRKLVLGCAVLWAIALAAAIPELWERGSRVRVVGWACPPANGTPQVTAITPGGPADGILQVGDRILSIDGQAGYKGFYTPAVQIWAYPPGTMYRARIDRRGQILDIRLTVGSRPIAQWPLIASFLFGSLTFAAIGWLMGWQRPEFLTARLGWIACQLTAFVYLSLALSATQSQGWAPPLLLSLLRMVGNCHLWFAFWYVAEFPYPPPPSRLWRRIRFALAVPAFLTWLAASCTNLAIIAGPYWLTRLPVSWTSILSGLSAFDIVLLGSGIVAVLIRNYRVFAEPAARRCIELVSGAIALAIGVMGAAALVAAIRGQPIEPLSNLAPLPVPICFAYAVLRHRVLDIRLALHRGLQYLLARQLLRAFTLLPLGLMVIRAIAAPSAPIGSLFNIVGIALVTASALALEFRERLRQWLDRWYLRPALDREKQLRAMATDITHITSVQELEQTVPDRLMAIFALESAGFDGNGVLRLGARTSGEPYTDSEQQLLDLVGAQIRLVRDNAQFAQGQSAAIQSERQRIAREIHDTAGHGFAGIALYMDAARKTFQAGAPGEANQFLEDAGALARKSLKETRASIAGLRESVNIDISARLHSLAERNHAGPPFITVHVEADAPRRASADARWHLSRIAEEAVANASKHAAASQIHVELLVLNRTLRLRVHDDGAGFDPATIQSPGYGLPGMKERTEQLQGTFTIISAPGQGTEICAEVPA